MRFLFTAALMCGAAGYSAGQESASVRPGGAAPAETVIVPNCHVSARETVEIPALERGSLLEILAEPGAEVRAGQVLGKLDDAEASLAVELAQQELRVAEQKLEIIKAGGNRGRGRGGSKEGCRTGSAGRGCSPGAG
ncbi:MAG UNVERIFIED_CONTAM: hypothetical protein LVR18_16995 [Planctomycetaceae bacterium]